MCYAVFMHAHKFSPRRIFKRRWLWLTGLALVLLGGSVAAEAWNHQPQAGMAILTLNQTVDLTYRLEWQSQAAQFDVTNWSVTNDLGYIIQVTDGYLANASVELIPCSELTPASQTANGWDWLRPQPVYAGHGIGTVDDSRLLIAQTESLAMPAAAALGTVSVSPNQYCKAHYLLAPIPNDTAQPDTFALSGTYTAPGSDKATPFSLSTAMAWGAISDLTITPAAQDASQSLTITVQRDLDHLFDGLDFNHQTDDEQNRAVLRGIANHIVVQIEGSRP